MKNSNSYCGKNTNRFSKCIAVMAAMLFYSCSAFGSHFEHGTAFYVDQDLFIPAKNEDRDYTMGIAVEFFKHDLEKHASVIAWLHQFIDRSLKPHWSNLFGAANKENEVVLKSVKIGQSVFTPDDIGESDPIYTDRPYSSLLYLAGKHIEFRGNTVIGSELEIGILGLNIAPKVQKWIHTNYRKISGTDEPVDPKGWDHQISEGGEPTLKYRLSFGNLLLQSSNEWWDIAGSSDINLGYQTNISVGLQARVGLIHSPFWTVPFDPVNRGNFAPSTSGNEAYLWMVHRARAIGYDALLQGQFMDSDVTFESGDIKRFVIESALGATAAFQNLQLTLSLNAKTAELNSQADRNHYWGGIYAVYRY